ncbi:MAG: hypothetical protein M1814_003159 [Vezdaea aestivalis]|nr:MAG: hypothetical protein M1814_003159 [Vezdaea aestivalis]
MTRGQARLRDEFLACLEAHIGLTGKKGVKPVIKLVPYGTLTPPMSPISEHEASEGEDELLIQSSIEPAISTRRQEHQPPVSLPFEPSTHRKLVYEFHFEGPEHSLPNEIQAGCHDGCKLVLRVEGASLEESSAATIAQALRALQLDVNSLKSKLLTETDKLHSLVFEGFQSLGASMAAHTQSLQPLLNYGFQSLHSSMSTLHKERKQVLDQGIQSLEFHVNFKYDELRSLIVNSLKAHNSKMQGSGGATNQYHREDFELLATSLNADNEIVRSALQECFKSFESCLAADNNTLKASFQSMDTKLDTLKSSTEEGFKSLESITTGNKDALKMLLQGHVGMLESLKVINKEQDMSSSALRTLWKAVNASPSKKQIQSVASSINTLDEQLKLSRLQAEAFHKDGSSTDQSKELMETLREFQSQVLVKLDTLIQMKGNIPTHSSSSLEVKDPTEEVVSSDTRINGSTDCAGASGAVAQNLNYKAPAVPGMTRKADLAQVSMTKILTPQLINTPYKKNVSVIAAPTKLSDATKKDLEEVMGYFGDTLATTQPLSIATTASGDRGAVESPQKVDVTQTGVDNKLPKFIFTDLCFEPSKGAEPDTTSRRVILFGFSDQVSDSHILAHVKGGPLEWFNIVNIGFAGHGRTAVISFIYCEDARKFVQWTENNPDATLGKGVTAKLISSSISKPVEYSIRSKPQWKLCSRCLLIKDFPANRSNAFVNLVKSKIPEANLETAKSRDEDFFLGFKSMLVAIATREELKVFAPRLHVEFARDPCSVALE